MTATPEQARNLAELLRQARASISAPRVTALVGRELYDALIRPELHAEENWRFTPSGTAWMSDGQGDHFAVMTTDNMPKREWKILINTHAHGFIDGHRHDDDEWAGIYE